MDWKSTKPKLKLSKFVGNNAPEFLGFVTVGLMGGSRIFDWGGPRIEEARDAGQNVAIFALKFWPIGGGHGPVPPPWNHPCISQPGLPS